MKVLIVGAGLSGLTLAAFLIKHEGFVVDVIDKEKDWSHVGYTIGIWDVGRRILSQLDLDDDFDRLGRQIHSFYLSDSRNNLTRLYHFDYFYKKMKLCIHILQEIFYISCYGIHMVRKYKCLLQ